jgi:hypothetical protein
MCAVVGFVTPGLEIAQRNACECRLALHYCSGTGAPGRAQQGCRNSASHHTIVFNAYAHMVEIILQLAAYTARQRRDPEAPPEAGRMLRGRHAL